LDGRVFPVTLVKIEATRALVDQMHLLPESEAELRVQYRVRTANYVLI